jgi:hypothetical protein
MKTGTCCTVLLLLIAVKLLGLVQYVVALEDGPVDVAAGLTVWYGQEQRVGVPGLTGRWVNVHGSVNPFVDGMQGYYRLNGGDRQELFFGPDGRRRSGAGDFIVEIDRNSLNVADNTVDIVVLEPGGTKLHEQVKLLYRPQQWPLPYHVDWQENSHVAEAVEIVDGIWQVSDGILRNVDRGYDRAIALGDGSWQSYEVEVRCSVSEIDGEAYRKPESVLPGFGIIQGWRGHSDTPVKCPGLHCGWFPSGALYFFLIPVDGPMGWNLNTRPYNDLAVEQIFPLEIDRRYIIKTRAQRGYLSWQYLLKVWEDGTPEPAEWMLSETAGRRNPAGGMLLFAHHTRLAVDSITTRPLPVSLLPRDGMIAVLAIATAGIGLAAIISSLRQSRTSASLAGFLVLLGLLFLAGPLLAEIPAAIHFNAIGVRLLYMAYDFVLLGLTATVWLWACGLLLFSKERGRTP